MRSHTKWTARGLSLKTGNPQGEEFPAFRAFWLEKPQKNTNSIVVHALLDNGDEASELHAHGVAEDVLLGGLLARARDGDLGPVGHALDELVAGDGGLPLARPLGQVADQGGEQADDEGLGAQGRG